MSFLQQMTSAGANVARGLGRVIAEQQMQSYEKIARDLHVNHRGPLLDPRNNEEDLALVKAIVSLSMTAVEAAVREVHQAQVV